MLTEGQKAKLAQYNECVSADSAAKKRLAALFDNGACTEIGAYAKSGDALCGVIAAYGFVNGNPVYAFSQDRTVKSGAVSKAQAAKICKVMELASRNGTPVVEIFDSCGAFVEDGADALNAYSDILMYTSNLSGVVPQIALVAGVCAGSAAMIAASADFLVMTKDSELYMAPATAAGNADAAAKAGVAAYVGDDEADAIEEVRKLITYMPRNNLSGVPEFEFEEASKAASGDAAAVAGAIADEGSIAELYADFGKASYVALATVRGATAGIVATNKTADKLTADDGVKIARFVRMCDAFSVPVITVVDTEGFAADEAAEFAGTVRTYAKVAAAYAEATTLKVALVTGKAYGPAFVAMAGNNAGSDMTFAYADAVIAAMNPVAAAEFLYHDKLKGASDVNAKRNELAARYADEFGSAFDAAAKGAVDGIITPAEARAKIISVLDIAADKRMNRTLPRKHSNMPF